MSDAKLTIECCGWDWGGYQLAPTLPWGTNRTGLKAACKIGEDIHLTWLPNPLGKKGEQFRGSSGARHGRVDDGRTFGAQSPNWALPIDVRLVLVGGGGVPCGGSTVPSRAP